MTLREQANQHWNLVKCSPPAIAVIRQEATALSVRILTEPEATFELTSSTVNGQTFSGKPTMTTIERSKLLGMVIWCLDNDCPIPSTTRLLF